MLIVSKCPLRVSLVGGGTDIPSVSTQLPQGGRTVGFSLNWHMTLIGHSFYQGIRLKYSEVEDVARASEIRHQIAREVLCRMMPELDTFEIASLCDVTGGTGLASSSAFTVALINLISRLKNEPLDPVELAYRACEAEIKWCGRPIGLQDQFLCASGGMNAVSFAGMERPQVRRVRYDRSWETPEGSPFLLVKVSGIHDSGAQLMDAGTKMKQYNAIRAMVEPAIEAIEIGDTGTLAGIVLESWQMKKAALASDANRVVDELLTDVRRIDPRAGGKLLGSGGGGFVIIISQSAKAVLAHLGDRARAVSVDSRPAHAMQV